VFPQELECPHFVEPQIIVRGKYTHNNANGKGSDCHPQHECMQRRALRCTSYFHADCCGPFAVSLRAGANRFRRFGEPPLPIFILVPNNEAGNEITQMRFCVCCGERLAW
jgi:hypothetical protein